MLKSEILQEIQKKHNNLSINDIEFILKNIERSYEKINSFSNSIDNLSLAKAQPIKLQLIKKVLDEIRLQ